MQCLNLHSLALQQLGRPAEARAVIEAALARDPENAATQATAGWAALKAGDPAKALQHFKEALRIDPSLDHARSGVVESIKAKNFPYGMMLRYFFWMGRLSKRAQKSIPLGGARSVDSGFLRSEGAMPHLILVCAAAVLAASFAAWLPAQVPEKTMGLGELLFSSTALSKGNGTSCATCHDPKKSFADGRAEAKGEMQMDTGRNTPALFAMGAIAKFRDPRQAQDAKPGRAPRVLTLEDRCLEPIENELEMGSRVEDAITALRKQPEWAKRFDDAFGDQEGVTKARLAKALAAFVRSLDAPSSAQGRAPYAEYLAGNQAALDAEQLRGLETFKRRGCAECHSGSALSDGLMHVVDPPWGQRMRDRQRTASERRVQILRREYAKKNTVAEVTAMNAEALAKEAKLRAGALPGGGGYDADQIEVQTTTLWDVRNTGPYFRDGSVAALEEAVRVHVKEMRAVDENEARVRKELVAVDQAGKRSPMALRPAAKPAAPPTSARSDLTESELREIMRYLDALSPPAKAR